MTVSTAPDVDSKDQLKKSGLKGIAGSLAVVLAAYLTMSDFWMWLTVVSGLFGALFFGISIKDAAAKTMARAGLCTAVVCLIFGWIVSCSAGSSDESVDVPSGFRAPAQYDPPSARPTPSVTASTTQPATSPRPSPTPTPSSTTSTTPTPTTTTPPPSSEPPPFSDPSPPPEQEEENAPPFVDPPDEEPADNPPEPDQVDPPPITGDPGKPSVG